jgi:hypothetical protein
MTFQILPPARSWSGLSERMARALVDGARRPTLEAALSLLFRLDVDFWMREDLQPFIKGDVFRAEVDWSGLNLAIEDGLASQGERAVVALAGSLAGEVEVDLEWALGHLTPELLEAFVAAVRHVAPSTEDGEQ